MNALIFCVFTCLAIFNDGCFATVDFDCGGGRGWRNDVETMFRTQCTANQQLPNSCQGAHLAHVLSWNGICDYADKLFSENRFDTLIFFVEILFEIDRDAQVWIGAGNPKTPLPHQSYIGVNLLNINNNFMKQAIDIVNDWKNGKNKNEKNVTTFRSLVNNAPANLRYGESGHNQGIGKFLDPMGDINQRLTDKEKHWNVLLEDLKCKQITSRTAQCTKCSGGCNDACRSSSASDDGTNFYVCKQ